MLDRTIPFYNTILRCDRYEPGDKALPDGFAISAYKPGYEKAWAELEYSVGDFDSSEQAKEYFINTYLKDRELYDRLLFVVNPENRVVGSCIAWSDMRNDKPVSSLHWLVVDEKYQGMMLWRALCRAVMEIYEKQNAFPVYIHTQPWSWKAIMLYMSLGFRIQKHDSFSHYENQYEHAMKALKEVVSPEQYELMRELSEE